MPSKPALPSLSRYSCSSSAPATQPIHRSTLRRMAGGYLATHHDVRNREAPARLEHPESLRQNAVLVGREVDHAVGDDDVHGVVRERDLLDLPLEAFHVLYAGFALS